MSVVLPRLDRATALQLIDEVGGLSCSEMSEQMPNLEPEVTYSPVGGTQIDEADLARLRASLLEIARSHGMPGPISETTAFESKSARLLRKSLDMTPHEAAHEEVWSYLTCCWLFDIAEWRFGPNAHQDRFLGHLNRNTFRRLWWRAEVFGPDIDLALFGEDELVNVMERPTLFSDRRLARAIVMELLTQVNRGAAIERMRLMREATKRLLRLTPFVSFAALNDEQLKMVVRDAFESGAAGLTGEAKAMPHRVLHAVPPASTEVTELPRLEIEMPATEPPSSLAAAARAINFEDVAQAAIDIAARTGRVTNIALREVVPMITATEARDVFRVLIERGDLARRGVKRGTHYVLPTEQVRSDGVAVDSAETTNKSVPPPQPASPPVPPHAPHRRSADTALRRLLKRMR